MAAEDYTGIRITNREVYDGLLQVRDRLQAVETRLDLVLSENVSIGKRVRSLELRYYAVLAGLLATLTGLGVTVMGTL